MIPLKHDRGCHLVALAWENDSEAPGSVNRGLNVATDLQSSQKYVPVPFSIQSASCLHTGSNFPKQIRPADCAAVYVASDSVSSVIFSCHAAIGPNRSQDVQG
jgi:hypothetical protein